MTSGTSLDPGAGARASSHPPTHDVAGDGRPRSRSWRLVDIVVASVLAVAFGAVFYGWTTFYEGLAAAFSAFPPARALLYGVWLVPGVLGALVVRKPGAAVYTEALAATVAALLGSVWGSSTVVYGLAQGLAAEAVVLAVRYRVWRLPVAVAAGALSGLAAAALDLWVYPFLPPEWSAGYSLAYLACVVASAAVLAGAGSWLLVRALARSGVLAPFAAGRDQRLV